jgi:hypothetical protein
VRRSEFIEDDEAEAGEIVGDAALLAGATLALEPVDQIDDVAPASRLREAAPRQPGGAGLDGAWQRR